MTRGLNIVLGVLWWCRVERRDTRHPAAFDTRARKEAKPDACAVSGASSADGKLYFFKSFPSFEDWSALLKGIMDSLLSV